LRSIVERTTDEQAEVRMYLKGNLILPGGRRVQYVGTLEGMVKAGTSIGAIGLSGRIAPSSRIQREEPSPIAHLRHQPPEARKEDQP
jgi:hypothetical protein